MNEALRRNMLARALERSRRALPFQIALGVGILAATWGLHAWLRFPAWIAWLLSAVAVFGAAGDAINILACRRTLRRTVSTAGAGDRVTTMLEALTGMADVRMFEVDNSGTDEPAQWQLVPLQGAFLPDAEGFFLLRAIQVHADGSTTACFLDLSMPERIADHAYFVRGEQLERVPLHEAEGEIISAVAVEAFGEYDLFYSRVRPEIGLDVLRVALAVAPRKASIAGDLGYILRDEERHAEAAAAFQVAVDEGPSSHYLLSELAECYRKSGEQAKAEKYQALFEEADRPYGSARKKRWGRLG